jgi:hypothetical protein
MTSQPCQVAFSSERSVKGGASMFAAMMVVDKLLHVSPVDMVMID